MANPYAELHSFVVDPRRDGISNALWWFVSGTPTVASNRFRFSAAQGVVRADLLYGRYEFEVIFPITSGQTPTNLVNDIEFGLRNVSLGNKSKIQVIADKSDDNFSLVTYDEDGITAQTTVIPWMDDWGGAATRFLIDWFSDRVVLSVVLFGEEERVVLATHKTRVGSQPLNIYVRAAGIENFDVSYILVEKAKSSSVMLI